MRWRNFHPPRRHYDDRLMRNSSGLYPVAHRIDVMFAWARSNRAGSEGIQSSSGVGGCSSVSMPAPAIGVNGFPHPG